MTPCQNTVHMAEQPTDMAISHVTQKVAQRPLSPTNKTRQLVCHPSCSYFLDLLMCRHLATHDTCKVIQVIHDYTFTLTFRWTACFYIISSWERECLRFDSIRISELVITVLWWHVSGCRKKGFVREMQQLFTVAYINNQLLCLKNMKNKTMYQISNYV